MAGELMALNSTGLNLYAILFGPAKQIWRTDITALEVGNAAHWSSYAITLSEWGSTGIYYGDLPSVPAGPYTVIVYQRAGSQPAVGDPFAGDQSLAWTGTALGYAGGPVTLADKTGFKLSPDGVDQIVVEPSVSGGTAANLRQAIAAIAAKEAGTWSKNSSSGAATFYAIGNPTVTRLIVTPGINAATVALTLPA